MFPRVITSSLEFFIASISCFIKKFLCRASSPPVGTLNSDLHRGQTSFFSVFSTAPSRRRRQSKQKVWTHGRSLGSRSVSVQIPHSVMSFSWLKRTSMSSCPGEVIRNVISLLFILTRRCDQEQAGHL